MTPWRGLMPPLAVVILLVAGCTLSPVLEDAAAPSLVTPDAAVELPLQWLREPGEAFGLDPASQITLRVYRAGRLARLGHNHVIEAIGLAGRLRHLDNGAGVADLRLRADRFRVDDAAARAAAGDDFAAMPKPAAIEGTRRNLLGPRVLDAAIWPEIRVLARIDDLRAGRSQATVYLSLRGLGRRYRMPVTIALSGGAIAVSGSVALRQSDLGITPFAALGGALQVRDEIDLEFRIIGLNEQPRL